MSSSSGGESRIAGVAIDAKYKLYDERGFDQGDIYQTFLYAFALGATGRVPTSLLLYPATVDESRHTRLRIRRLSGGAGADIVGIGLPVAALLNELTGGATDRPQCRCLAEVIEGSLGLAGRRQAAAGGCSVRIAKGYCPSWTNSDQLS